MDSILLTGLIQGERIDGLVTVWQIVQPMTLNSLKRYWQINQLFGYQSRARPMYTRNTYAVIVDSVTRDRGNKRDSSDFSGHTLPEP